ncbi:MAG: hypothetical protein QOI34_1507 [Verrucomicrobiota bacterium]
MRTPPSIVALVLLSLALITTGARADTVSIQGDVRAPDGKALSGGDVKIERVDAQASIANTQTDAKGHYSFRGLPIGTYKLTVWTDKKPKSVARIKTRNDGWVRVDFDLSATAGKPGKSGKRKIWVPSEPGSHIAGRWVEVDDNNQGTSSRDTIQGQDLRRLQQNSVGTSQIPTTGGVHGP